MQKPNYTLSALSVAESVGVEPEYIRLPRAGDRDPIFGLSRAYLNLLVLPCQANDFRPPVKSSVLRKRGAKTGVRLVNVDSLREYIHRNQEPTYIPPKDDSSEK